MYSVYSESVAYQDMCILFCGGRFLFKYTFLRSSHIHVSNFVVFRAPSWFVMHTGTLRVSGTLIVPLCDLVPLSIGHAACIHLR